MAPEGAAARPYRVPVTRTRVAKRRSGADSNENNKYDQRTDEFACTSRHYTTLTGISGVSHTPEIVPTQRRKQQEAPHDTSRARGCTFADCTCSYIASRDAYADTRITPRLQRMRCSLPCTAACIECRYCDCAASAAAAGRRWCGRSRRRTSLSAVACARAGDRLRTRDLRPRVSSSCRHSSSCGHIRGA